MVFAKTEGGGYMVTGTAGLSKFYKNFTVKIPSEVKGEPVVAIANAAFSGYTSLIYVEIPDTVEYIGEGAFWDCILLPSVSIPDSVKYIGAHAFRTCTLLGEVNIPESVTYIGEGAFWGCGSLRSINVHENNQSYKSIDGNLFDKDGTTLMSYALGNAAESYKVPDTVTSISDSAFNLASSLKSIELPDSVISIDDNAFSYCDRLESISIPDSVQYIGEDLISNSPLVKLNAYDNALYLGNEENPYVILCSAKDTAITSCEISGNTKHIANEAFKNCSSLTGITMPSSVLTLGDYAFSGCKSLSKAVLSDSLSYVGNNPFMGCGALEYNVYEEGKYLGSDNTPYLVLMTCGAGSDSRIHDSTRFVCANAYAGAFLHKDAKLPDSVVGICECAFMFSSLKSVTIPSSVKYIESWAFYGANSLKTVNFSGSVEEWNAIEKADDWNAKTKFTEIICSDGRVAIE